VVAASLAVTRAGAREGMPTAGELEVALARGRR
jgi:sugar/nucleoside kinase (ribokinase family)